MGCSRATWTCVTHGDAFTRSKSQSSAATANTAPKMLSLEKVLVLRWKICDIGRAIDGSRNGFVQTQGLLIRCGRDLRSIALTQRVARKPCELGVCLEDLMAELEPLMTFAWRDIKMGRYSVALQCAIHLGRLGNRNARVVLADEEQRRRFDVRGVLDWRVIPEHRK